MVKPLRIEQIYAEIKQTLDSHHMRPGQRVDVEALAAHFGVSKIPIRMLMRQLVGEGVLEVAPHEGYIIPWMNEQRLANLYRTNRHMLLSAIQTSIGSGPARPVSLPAMVSEDLIDHTEAIFLSIAGLDQNAETVRIVRNLNDRLRAARVVETAVDVAHELAELRAAWDKDDLNALEDLIHAYHGHRMVHVSKTVSLLYANAGPPEPPV